MPYPLAIDMHSHYHGAGVVDVLRRRKATPRLEVGADGTDMLVTSTKKMVFKEHDRSIETRIEFMDSIGLTKQLLVFPGNMGIDVLPVAEAIPIVTAYNDGLAEQRHRNSDRFVTLAGLPFADMNAAARELRRARLELGHIGAIIPTGYVTDLEMLERLRPLFNVADEIGAHFLIHPGPRHDQLNIDSTTQDFAMQRASVLDLQNGVSHAVVTLTLSDFLKNFSNVSVQVINLGGTIPFILERMEYVVEVRTPDAPRDLARRLRRLYVDSGSMGARALELAVRVFGADRVMLGTDFPFFPTSRAQDAVEEANLTNEQKTMVRMTTAETLLDRYQ